MRPTELCAPRARTLALAGVLLLGTSACSWNRVVGSGIAASEPRDVGGFESIHISGSADVVARAGEAHSLTITCDDNLLPFVQTEVEGGRLEIDMASGWYDFNHGLEVVVTAPTLTGVSISGSGDVDVRGLQGPDLALRISGSGDIRAEGRVERLSAAISGSGGMDLFGLAAREADVSISGSGNIGVHASEALAARISGSGDVTYEGRPATTMSISGSGSVQAR